MKTSYMFQKSEIDLMEKSHNNKMLQKKDMRLKNTYLTKILKERRAILNSDAISKCDAQENKKKPISTKGKKSSADYTKDFVIRDSFMSNNLMCGKNFNLHSSVEICRADSKNHSDEESSHSDNKSYKNSTMLNQKLHSFEDQDTNLDAFSKHNNSTQIRNFQFNNISDEEIRQNAANRTPGNENTPSIVVNECSQDKMISLNRFEKTTLKKNDPSQKTYQDKKLKFYSITNQSFALEEKTIKNPVLSVDSLQIRKRLKKSEYPALQICKDLYCSKYDRKNSRLDEAFMNNDKKVSRPVLNTYEILNNHKGSSRFPCQDDLYINQNFYPNKQLFSPVNLSEKSDKTFQRSQSVDFHKNTRNMFRSSTIHNFFSSKKHSNINNLNKMHNIDQRIKPSSLINNKYSSKNIIGKSNVSNHDKSDFNQVFIENDANLTKNLDPAIKAHDYSKNNCLKENSQYDLKNSFLKDDIQYDHKNYDLETSHVYKNYSKKSFMDHYMSRNVHFSSPFALKKHVDVSKNKLNRFMNASVNFKPIYYNPNSLKIRISNFQEERKNHQKEKIQFRIAESSSIRKNCFGYNFEISRFPRSGDYVNPYKNFYVRDSVHIGSKKPISDIQTQSAAKEISLSNENAGYDSEFFYRNKKSISKHSYENGGFIDLIKYPRNDNISKQHDFENDLRRFSNSYHNIDNPSYFKKQSNMYERFQDTQNVHFNNERYHDNSHNNIFYQQFDNYSQRNSNGRQARSQEFQKQLFREENNFYISNRFQPKLVKTNQFYENSKLESKKTQYEKIEEKELTRRRLWYPRIENYKLNCNKEEQNLIIDNFRRKIENSEMCDFDAFYINNDNFKQLGVVNTHNSICSDDEIDEEMYYDKNYFKFLNSNSFRLSNNELVFGYCNIRKKLENTLLRKLLFEVYNLAGSYHKKCYVFMNEFYDFRTETKLISEDVEKHKIGLQRLVLCMKTNTNLLNILKARILDIITKCESEHIQYCKFMNIVLKPLKKGFEKIPEKIEYID